MPVRLTVAVYHMAGGREWRLKWYPAGKVWGALQLVRFKAYAELTMPPLSLTSVVPALQCCREAAEKYPDIQYEEVIIDNACMMVSE